MGAGGHGPPPPLQLPREAQAVGYPRINAPGLFRGLFNPALSCKLLCVACPSPPGEPPEGERRGAAHCPQEVEEAGEQMLCSQPQDIPHSLRGGKSSCWVWARPLLPALDPCGCLMKRWHRGVNLGAGAPGERWAGRDEGALGAAMEE